MQNIQRFCQVSKSSGRITRSVRQSHSHAHSHLSVVKDPHALAYELSGKHFVNGVLRPSEHTFAVHNPATGEFIANGAKGNASDVNIAVELAANAQKSWGALPVRQRGELVQKCAGKIKEHLEELALLTSLETGKAIRTESRVEATVVGDVFSFFGGLAPEIKGITLPWNPNSHTFTKRDPIGVVGAIIPWNAPLLLMALKIAPALVCGNSVIVKSAEEAPLGATRLAQIISTVLPPGVINVLSGYGPECGAPLVTHPKVGKVTFTGSVETGKIIYKLAADKIIPVTLELGGKSPMIVAADADLGKAVDGAVVGMRFTRQGQSCTAASRIFVHETIYDEFVQKLKAKVDAMKMGNPLDNETDMGTVISKAQFEKIQSYISTGMKEKGVKALFCSQLPTDPALKKGLFLQPVLMTNITNGSKVSREEIFGPICSIIKWKDADKVIEEANDSEFGLSASVWTNDLKFAMSAVNKLDAGIVQVNQNAVVQSNLPVGGLKLSGLGREGDLQAMLDGFTKVKTVSINMN